MEPINVADYERLAEAALDPGAWGYFAGGAGDEWTLAANVAAFRGFVLRPRVCVDVAATTTATTVLGQDVSLPVLLAPVAFQRVLHPDGELATARAARAAGTIYCQSTLSTATLAEVAAEGAARWFQLYVFRDAGVTRGVVEQARAEGFGALVLTVDTPYLGRRERDLRTGFTISPDVVVPALGRGGVTPHAAFELMSSSVTWRDVEAFVAEAGLPVVLKGIQTGEDARLAVEHGASGIVVSNHGGRQLDGAAASLHVLHECVEAVDARIEVLVDGGVRRGTDVAKALALGARAVLVGRPYVWGLAVAGEAGVRHVLSLLADETRLALALLGCTSPSEVTAAHVAPARRA